MELKVLADESVKPNDELIFSILGEKELLWKQTISYMYDNNNDISEVWKCYNDGKSWLFRTLKRRKPYSGLEYWTIHSVLLFGSLIN